MDEQACVHEKSRSSGSDSHDLIREIRFRELTDADLFFLGELYWQFCKDVNQEDVSAMKTFEIGGEQVQITEAEARLIAYFQSGFKIQGVFINDVLAGFLIYQEIFDKLISIRAMFIDRWAISLKLGKALVQSLPITPHTIIFQTRKTTEPARCLKVTDAHRIKIAEDTHFITWSMPWRSDGRNQLRRDGRLD